MQSFLYKYDESQGNESSKYWRHSKKSLILPTGILLRGIQYTLHITYIISQDGDSTCINSNHEHILTSKKSSNSILLAGDYAT